MPWGNIQPREKPLGGKEIGKEKLSPPRSERHLFRATHSHARQDLKCTAPQGLASAQSHRHLELFRGVIYPSHSFGVAWSPLLFMGRVQSEAMEQFGAICQGGQQQKTMHTALLRHKYVYQPLLLLPLDILCRCMFRFIRCVFLRCGQIANPGCGEEARAWIVSVAQYLVQVMGRCALRKVII